MRALNILYKYLNSRFKRGFNLRSFIYKYLKMLSSDIKKYAAECLKEIEKGIELYLYANKNHKLCFVECITVKTPSM